jgi:ferric-dicitrate binding protein FerR (iron transport regulator)
MEQMEQTAKILFQKFLNGTCSQQELDQLMEILQRNEHETAFRSMLKKVYQDIDRSFTDWEAGEQMDGLDIHQDLPVNDQLLGETKEGTEMAFPNARKGRRYRLYAAVAAACLLIAAGGAYVWQHTSRRLVQGADLTAKVQADKLPKGPYKNQQTTRAEQKHLILPDGTEVWLNAESSLIIPDQFDSDKRVVFLKGEAFFDVKHADKVPFIIHMPNNFTTTVLGTAFDIKAYGSKAFSVSVKRGKVRVSKDEKSLATLTVGQQIKMEENHDIQPVVQAVKKENIASWTEGKLSYDASELLDVLHDLERVYNIQIDLKNKQLSGEVITTTFNRADGIEKILKTLCMLTGSRLQIVDQKYIIE